MLIDPFSALITVLISFFGAFFAYWFQRVFGKEQRRQELTQRYIDELLGSSFFPHVIAVSNVRRQYLEAEEPNLFIQNVAAGYWYPGARPFHIGDTSSGLTDHQHIELTIRFSSRLSDSIQSNMVDKARIKDILADDYHWTYSFLRVIAVEVERQRGIASNLGRSSEAKWVKDIEFLGSFFDYKNDLTAERILINEFR